MSTLIKQNGKWVKTSGGTVMWVGTQAQLEEAMKGGEIPDGTAVMVTDDYETGGGGADVPDDIMERIEALEEAVPFIGVADPFLWTAADLGMPRPAGEGMSKGTPLSSDWTSADGRVTVKADCILCRVESESTLNKGMGIYTRDSSIIRPSEESIIQIRVNGKATIKVMAQKNSDGAATNRFCIYNEVGDVLASQTFGGGGNNSELTYEYDGGANGKGGTLYVSRGNGTVFIDWIKVNY